MKKFKWLYYRTASYNIEMNMEKEKSMKEGNINIWNTQINSKAVYYVLCVVVYIISFIYLFNYKSTEYIAYIITFILNCIFPIIWLEDLQKFLRFHGTRMMMYKVYSILLSSILVFIALFLVIITNEKVRKVKIREYKANTKDCKSEAIPVDNLYTTDNKKEYLDKVILILFTTITALIWGMLGETFSNSNTPYARSFDKNNANMDNTTNFSRSIGTLLDIPHYCTETIDKWIKNIADKFVAPPLVKSFVIYCITFIVVFFGAFVRIPKHPEDIQNKMDRFQIVNMENVFTEKYERNYQQYRDLCLFVWSSLISIIAIFGLNYVVPSIQSYIPFINNPMAKPGIISGIIALVFGLFYGLRHTLKDRKNKTKKLVLSTISLIFALVGTPVVMAIMQLGLTLNDSSLNSYTREHNANKLSISFGFIFLVLFLFSTIYSTTKLIHNLKSLKMYIVVLICMTISLFMSLTSQYSMFTMLYKMAKLVIEGVIVYLAPITAVALSIVQFVFSLENHQKYLNMLTTDNSCG